MDPFKVWQTEMKAEELTTSQLDLWLAGDRGRGVLVVPFTGPLPGGKAGLDLDGDYFDEDTDLFGGFAELMRSRDRLVDWHHDMDPTGKMKGAILGRITLEDKAADDGLWAEFWVNAGEQRRMLMGQLEKAGVPLFGSSQALSGHIRKTKASDGTHIDVWPLIRHTITTSPQNTHAAVPSLKALLEGDIPSGSVSIAALHAALLGLGASPWVDPSGQTGSLGSGSVGRRPALDATLGAAVEALGAILTNS